METAPAPAPASTYAGPSSEASVPATYDEDSRHYAITASQAPKLAGSMPLPGSALGAPSDFNLRDGKSIGTRFLEDCHETDLPGPRLRSSRMIKGQGREATGIEQERKRPLRLLDLPVDILKDIVKEVTHTNDLTSLALCHSALHRLTIPHIYSRFDIVWPDSSVHAEPRSGVDALTYGLATLVMGEEVFGEAPSQRRDQANRFSNSSQGRATEASVRRRRGNHYAQFTRKFSLGNGPADWVQEYLINKEGGKMLGTLVALAVARMRALETFTWDMPTGILRDVWLALSSLGDREDRRPCRLEKLWVRWHDNTSADAANPLPPPPPPYTAAPTPLQTSGSQPTSAPQLIHPAALDRVEHPSFSVLPPLKSLSVLDIDELAYLDEMAVLIGRSLDKLRELRIGIARHALNRDWVTVWEGDNVQQVDLDYPTAGSLTIGEKRLGGVLGTVTGLVCDMRKPKLVLPDRTKKVSHAKAMPHSDTQTSSHATTAQAEEANSSLVNPAPEELTTELPPSRPGSAIEDNPSVATSSHASPEPPTNTYSLISQEPPVVSGVQPETSHAPESGLNSSHYDLFPIEPPPAYLSNRLQLTNLELERVPLAIPVLQKAIDWSKLTSLTILHCQNHEALWKTLRHSFSPTQKSPTYPQARRTPNSTPRKSSKASAANADVELEYRLALKRIHTNAVSPALISFLKDTLAPNSLEVLFLQEARSYSSSVTVDAIFRGPLRRHRNSLKKVLIDSSEKSLDGLPTNSSRWRRWMLSREILGFLCSGKMPALRELGMAINYHDWHFFLQHLPAVPHLRSIYIPFLADHVHGTNADPRELALQIVDIVALRPEVELCYMGIANKCFEILENKRDSNSRSESRLGLSGDALGETADSDAENDGDDEEDLDGAEDEDDDDAEDIEGAEGDDTESDDDLVDDDTDSEQGSVGAKNTARLRLREILFYDDKVAIFKARHGRL